MPITLTDINYPTEITKSSNAVIDLYTKWCGPCKTMSPHFDQAEKNAQQQNNGVKFYKVDIENADSVETAKFFEISCIPTIIFIRDGKIVKRVEGAVYLTEIQNIIDQYILNPKKNVTVAYH